MNHKLFDDDAHRRRARLQNAAYYASAPVIVASLLARAIDPDLRDFFVFFSGAQLS